MSNAPSVSAEEIAQFGRLAADWWDVSGPMRPLHDMNPLRTGWNDKWFRTLGPNGEKHGLRLLDIGCGAGIASEAYARLGYDVTGLDASEDAIAAARAHQALYPIAEFNGRLKYVHGAAEDLITQGETFDVVSALEIIEHVTDPNAFMSLLAALTRPGGLVCVSTLNRTLKALAIAKFGAEYVLRLLPAGTHQWRKFVKPAELVRAGRQAGLKLRDITGIAYTGSACHLTPDTGMNYQAIFQKL